MRIFSIIFLLIMACGNPSKDNHAEQQKQDELIANYEKQLEEVDELNKNSQSIHDGFYPVSSEDDINAVILPNRKLNTSFAITTQPILLPQSFDRIKQVDDESFILILDNSGKAIFEVKTEENTGDYIALVLNNEIVTHKLINYKAETGEIIFFNSEVTQKEMDILKQYCAKR